MVKEAVWFVIILLGLLIARDICPIDDSYDVTCHVTFNVNLQGNVVYNQRTMFTLQSLKVMACGSPAPTPAFPRTNPCDM